MARKKYRLGLDIGTNSIGWSVIRLDADGRPCGFIRNGVRIFSDGRDAKTLTSNAAQRRKYRQMRRRHDRVLKRMNQFLGSLVRHGLLPEGENERRKLASFDPYMLRGKALDQKLSPYELGRALYHLAKRRGFQSSRKDRSADEKEAGKIKSAIKRTMEQIEAAGCRTLGEFLAKRHERREPVRARLDIDKEYLFYVRRDMVMQEFDAIWASQRQYHPDLLTDEAREDLRQILLFQRPLHPVEPGRCTFEPGEPRLPKCSPLFQRFRVYQELNSLRVTAPEQPVPRPLAREERDALADLLLRPEDPNKIVTWAAMRRHINLPKDARFTHESGGPDGKRKGFAPDPTYVLSLTLGEAWTGLSGLQREALAVLVTDSATNEDLRLALRGLPDIEFSRKIIRSVSDKARIQPWLEALAAWPAPLSEDVVEALVDVSLPEDYANLGRKAIEKMLPELEAEVITYDEAARRAGYDHSNFYTGEIFARLPYYGKVLRGHVVPHPQRNLALAEPADNDDGHEQERYYGRIPNPTVHIGLNQLRLLVNAIIRRYGPPEEIIVEVAREFGLSGERRREIEREQKKNQELNEQLDAELKKLGQRPSRENRLRLKLWRELGNGDAMDRECVYSGERFSIQQLFSGEVEIDHILPFSRTLDDSFANKVLCKAWANRQKRGKTPYETFSGADFESVTERANRLLPRRKAARFRKEAFDVYRGRKNMAPEVLAEYGIAETEGFLVRHLIDTSYLARVAKEYLAAICPPNKVWVSTGRLTGLLRSIWRLDSILDNGIQGKNRNDHRHHAIDAAIVGVCDRRLVQKLSTAARRADEKLLYRLLDDLDEPWAGFCNELRDSVSRIVVSHKPERGLSGGLHEDTNYGARSEPDSKGVRTFVVRKQLTDIQDKDIEKIFDPGWRQKLMDYVGSRKGADFKKAVIEFSQQHGIRRLRLATRLSAIPIRDRNGNAYRYVKGGNNYCYDIWKDAKGKWTGESVSVFDANQKDFDDSRPYSRDGRPLVMRVHTGDMMLIEDGERKRVMRVQQLSKGKLTLVEHKEANAAERQKEEKLFVTRSPNELRKMKARLVGVDLLGYVNDPGFLQ